MTECNTLDYLDMELQFRFSKSTKVLSLVDEMDYFRDIHTTIAVYGVDFSSP